MFKHKKEPKRAVNVVLEEKYIRQLDALGEALIRPTKSDVIRFLIADAAKKFLNPDCSIVQSNPHATNAAAGRAAE